MSPDDFRRIALRMVDAIEGAHMGHPDFRINGRIFATLHPDHLFGMVKLTPGQQHRFVREIPQRSCPRTVHGDAVVVRPCGWTRSMKTRSEKR